MHQPTERDPEDRRWTIPILNPRSSILMAARCLVSALSTWVPRWWTQTAFPGTDVSEDTTRPIRQWLLLLVVVAAALLFSRLTYPLIEPDEARHAEIAREMLQSGDWIVPRINHVPYFDKPPLLHWLCAASYSLFGVRDWAARLVPAAAAFLTVMATFLLGRRLLGTGAAFWGALMLVLSIEFLFCGRFLIMDSLLTLCVVAALLAAYEAGHRERFDWRWWIFSAACCGLGILTKGPIALVLVAPPVAASSWLSRCAGRPRFKHWLAYGCVANAIAGWWFAAMLIREPGFAEYFFYRHHLHRFVEGLSHTEPFWFFLPVLFVGLMPWSLLLFPLARFLGSSAPDLRVHRPPVLGFLLLWASWCVLFFSLSADKLPHYILPALPAVMLLLGYFLNQVLREPAWKDRFRFVREQSPRWGAVGVCIAGLVGWVVVLMLRLESAPDIMLQAGVWGLAIVAAVLFVQRLSVRAAWTCFCLVAFAGLFQATGDWLAAWGQTRTFLPQQTTRLTPLRNPQVSVATFDTDWGSVPFYLRRDDVRHFSGNQYQELVAFLEQHVKPTAEHSSYHAESGELRAESRTTGRDAASPALCSPPSALRSPQPSAFLVTAHDFDERTLRQSLPAHVSLERWLSRPRVHVFRLSRRSSVGAQAFARPQMRDER